MRIERLPHAIVFCGEEGSGALPLALSLAKDLLCPHKTTDNQSCGVCPSCHQVAKFIHPDLHFAVPVNRPKGVTSSKPPITDEFLDLWRQALAENPTLTEQDWYRKIEIENKQGIISAAEAENIFRKMQFKPFESDSKVLIIWLPERMHITAANKLLKLLEEPPAGTFFLMVSYRPQLILPTVKSRCMAIQVAPSGVRILSKEQYADTARLLELCRDNKPDSVLNWAENMASLGREAQKEFVVLAQRFIRSLLMLHLSLPALSQLDPTDAALHTPLAKSLPLSFFDHAYQKLNEEMGQLERNVNARPLFCSLAFDFYLSLNSIFATK